MGLLDAFFSDDPRQQALMATALSLLGGNPHTRRNFGADLSNAGMQGLLTYGQGKQQQSLLADRALQQQLMQTQVSQAQRQQTMQDAMDAAAKRNAVPGQPEMLPTDYETPSGPVGPSSFNLPGYARDVMGINPQMGIGLQAQLAALNAKNLQKLGPGETLYDVNAGKPAFSAPALPKMVDVGNAIQPTDPVTGKPVGAPIPKSMSPDAQASNSIARENLGINKQKLGIEQFNADPSGMFGINPRPMPQGAAQSAQTSGADYLGTLPKPIADQVQALADGRMQFPGGFALKSPYWQRMLTMVSQYDPSFDAINYNARSGVRKDFTSGNSAKSLNALNTVAGHLDELDKSIDQLKNSNFTPYNMVANPVAKAFGKTNVTNFQTVLQTVMPELERAYRGSGGSEGSLQRWQSALSGTNGFDQQKAAVKELATLLNSKIQSLGDQYNKGMGTSGQGLQILSPKAQKTFERLSGQSVQGQANGGSEFKVLGVE